MRAKQYPLRCAVPDVDEETLLKRVLRKPVDATRSAQLTGSLAEANEDETELLGPIIDLADLKDQHHQPEPVSVAMRIKLRLLNQPEPGTAFWSSRLLKRGMPVDADLVPDAPPNPYWKPELRDQSGLDPLWSTTWPHNRT